MEQKWTMGDPSKIRWLFRYPIQGENDPMVEEVISWLEDSVASMNNGWHCGFQIIPDGNNLLVRRYGKPWTGFIDHPQWFAVTFSSDKENEAMMFKLRWC